jgi:pimeloyl-ACP methyl ester carboxylesterase
MFIHGRHDVLAELKYAEALAHRLRAQLTVLDGAHFVTRECAHEVNLLLRTLINGHIPHRCVRAGCGWPCVRCMIRV